MSYNQSSSYPTGWTDEYQDCCCLKTKFMRRVDEVKTQISFAKITSAEKKSKHFFKNQPLSPSRYRMAACTRPRNSDCRIVMANPPKRYCEILSSGALPKRKAPIGLYYHTFRKSTRKSLHNHERGPSIRSWSHRSASERPPSASIRPHSTASVPVRIVPMSLASVSVDSI